MSISKILKEQQISKSSKAVQQMLDDNGITAIKVDQYVASGYNGDIFTIRGRPNVIKLIHHSDNIEKNYRRFIGKRFDNLMNVLYYKKMTVPSRYMDGFGGTASENMPLGLIVLEGLEPWRNEDEEFYLMAYNVMRDIGETQLNDMTRARVSPNNPIGLVEIIRQTYGNAINDRIIVRMIKRVADTYQNTNQQNRDKLDKFLNDVINGIKELESIGFKHRDLRTENIMQDKDSDNYKIIDFDILEDIG